MSDVIAWVECPECGGDEGHVVGDGDYWEDCPWCDGQGGVADLTPPERDEYLAAYQRWLSDRTGK